jgi:hypothetical protein
VRAIYAAGVRGAMRGLGWSIGAVAVVAVTAVAVRAARGRLAREPGGSKPQRGSFDSWPSVPLAPGRLVPNGSRVPTGS